MDRKRTVAGFAVRAAVGPPRQRLLITGDAPRAPAGRPGAGFQPSCRSSGSYMATILSGGVSALMSWLEARM